MELCASQHNYIQTEFVKLGMDGDDSKEMNELWSVSLKVMREILKTGRSISDERMTEICPKYAISYQIMKANVFVEHWDGSVSFDYRFMREFARKEVERANR